MFVSGGYVDRIMEYCYVLNSSYSDHVHCLHIRLSSYMYRVVAFDRNRSPDLGQSFGSESLGGECPELLVHVANRY